MRIPTGLLAAVTAIGLAVPAPASAQEAAPGRPGGVIPERRVVLDQDVDLPGGDLQQLFNTTAEACVAVCLATPDCQALTYNTRARSCFPKGAGAGLPGLVLAIARPDLRMTLVEPLLRRTVWLERVIDDLELDNVEVVRARADELWGQRSFDVVTSRAVAWIGELARWSLPLVQRGGEMFVLKGSSAALERDEDASILRKLKVVEADVETWGAGIVDPETVTLRLSVEGVAPQLTRKQAGTGPSTAKKKAARRQGRRD